ncbi:MAG: hypothetical protein KGL35_10965 [Bradyrhizobium sp.]|nr:hypothetical protein [Bradyrhizobium sp.]
MSTEMAMVIFGQAANILLVAFFAGRVSEAVTELKRRVSILERKEDLK